MENRGTHLFEHVDNVIAGNTVCTQSNCDSGIANLGHARDAVRELCIRFWTMYKGRLFASKKVEIRVFEIDRMNKKHFGPEQPQPIEVGKRATTCGNQCNASLSPSLRKYASAPPHKHSLILGFRDMRGHAETLLLGKPVHGLKKLWRNRVGSVRRHAKAQSVRLSRTISVDFFLQIGDRLVGLTFCGTEDFLIGNALQPKLPHCLPRCAEVHHFAEACDSSANHFDAAETRRCQQFVASEVLILSPGELGDPIGEGKILEKASKNSEFEVRMGIDEAGNDSAAGKCYKIVTLTGPAFY